MFALFVFLYRKGFRSVITLAAFRSLVNLLQVCSLSYVEQDAEDNCHEQIHPVQPHEKTVVRNPSQEFNDAPSYEDQDERSKKRFSFHLQKPLLPLVHVQFLLSLH